MVATMAETIKLDRDSRYNIDNRYNSNWEWEEFDGKLRAQETGRSVRWSERDGEKNCEIDEGRNKQAKREIDAGKKFHFCDSWCYKRWVEPHTTVWLHNFSIVARTLHFSSVQARHRRNDAGALAAGCGPNCMHRRHQIDQGRTNAICTHKNNNNTESHNTPYTIRAAAE